MDKKKKSASRSAADFINLSKIIMFNLTETSSKTVRQRL